MSATRRFHRTLGLVLLLPMFGWAATGFVFFAKPGYQAAYGGLQVRLYPVVELPAPAHHPEWLEVRYLRTTLGNHLLVRNETGWSHLDPVGLERRALPDEATLRRLVEDATAPERDRYGEIAAVARAEGEIPTATIKTTTGVEIELEWNTLTLRQSGRDTRLIDTLYRIHYLQWTGIRLLDRVLGIVGLVSLITLAGLGARLAVGGPR